MFSFFGMAWMMITLKLPYTDYSNWKMSDSYCKKASIRHRAFSSSYRVCILRYRNRICVDAATYQFACTSQILYNDVIHDCGSLNLLNEAVREARQSATYCPWQCDGAELLERRKPMLRTVLISTGSIVTIEAFKVSATFPPVIIMKAAMTVGMSSSGVLPKMMQ